MGVDVKNQSTAAKDTSEFAGEWSAQWSWLRSKMQVEPMDDQATLIPQHWQVWLPWDFALL